jgi:hypothetical protein
MRCFLLCCVLISLSLHAQKVNKRIRLTAELNEISGLALLNDSVLMGINDSGNSPDLFFMDTSGKILKKTRILNAQNTDWEDLTLDNRGYLYIADVGNNLNNRRDLHFLKLSANDAFMQDTISAQEIRFNYPDQKEFPPLNSELRFNCEAVFWMSDSLYLLTKNESKFPRRMGYWDRDPKLYAIPDVPATSYVARLMNLRANQFFKPKKRGFAYLVTSAAVRQEYGYVLTYQHLFIFKWSKIYSEISLVFQKKFSFFKQREAIAVAPNGRTIYISAEKHRFFGGPFLYIMEQKRSLVEE